jgi:hypothetical protein
MTWNIKGTLLLDDTRLNVTCLVKTKDLGEDASRDSLRWSVAVYPSIVISGNGSVNMTQKPLETQVSGCFPKRTTSETLGVGSSNSMLTGPSVCSDAHLSLGTTNMLKIKQKKLKPSIYIYF